MEELGLYRQEIFIEQGSVVFNNFEEIKNEAAILAESIKTVEVGEENIKQSKKMLAAVNKEVKKLEDKRIEIKKMMLQPYSEFEAQVKEIVLIVKEADETVRQQVKQLEEEQRLEKQKQLEEIFAKRIEQYNFGDLFTFLDFLKPKHLNKTAAIESTEKEMIEFLERLRNDIKAIESMANAEAVMSAYVESKDLAAAMTLVNKQEERRRQIEASRAISKSAKKEFHFTVFDEKDFKLVQMMMQQEQIKFEVREF